jgi:purine-nucleoside phosphorylase
MYKHFGKSDIQNLLGISDTYVVDALLVVGTQPKRKEHAKLYAALEKLNLPYTEEELSDSFFEEIKVLNINGKRIWFDVVYGAAYLSEIAHVASMLGSKMNLLMGSCGGLDPALNMGDTILPVSSYGNESSTRMYQRETSSYIYDTSLDLRSSIKNLLTHRSSVYEGRLVTVQAMLAETKEDVENWSAQGYLGVDMETATLFAVSNHFNVPSAALLYVGDNLVKNELINNPSYIASKAFRRGVSEENYEIMLRFLVSN